MRTVNMHEAKTNLSKLIAMAVNGEPFVIARAGKPLVTVAAIERKPAAKRVLGFLEGKYKVPKDIKAFGRKEIDAMFFGNPGKFDR